MHTPTGKVSTNPFADPALAAGYEAWYQTAGRRADQLEKALLAWLLARLPMAATFLDVGCGSGHFTRWFKGRSLRVAGLDVSLPMLSEAARLDRAPYVLGDALALPFTDNAFDVVALITTLEFVSEPVRALEEALRVARQGLILGVLNRRSILGWQRRREGGPVWEAAAFFTPAEMTHMVRRAARRPVEIVWRTTLWPFWPWSLPLPWGGFIGMAVQLARS